MFDLFYIKSKNQFESLLENARKVNEFDYNKMMSDFESESRHKKILLGIRQKWRAVSCSYKEKLQNLKRLNEKTYKEKSKNLQKKLKKKEEVIKNAILARHEAKSQEKKKLLEQMSYDFATSRAVARLNILLELTAPYVKVGGYVLAMKGSAAREELAEAKSAITKLGLKLEKVADFQVEDATHSVIVLKKIKATPAQYPRRYAKIKQAPL